MNKFEGSEYKNTKDLAPKEIAKIVKKEISEILKNEYNQYGMKISVTSKNYSSINIEIVDSKINLLDDLKEATGEIIVLLKRMEKIANRYNYDDSDSQIDHFDTRFYVHADINWELEKRFKKEKRELNPKEEIEAITNKINKLKEISNTYIPENLFDRRLRLQMVLDTI